jgi:tryptophan-rich sensory protein
LSAVANATQAGWGSSRAPAAGETRQEAAIVAASTARRATISTAAHRISSSAKKIGALAAREQDEAFYESLRRPGWAPPAEVFSPVWTALYATIALAGWLVARQGLGRRAVRVALALFVAQLALNAA